MVKGELLKLDLSLFLRQEILVMDRPGQPGQVRLFRIGNQDYLFDGGIRSSSPFIFSRESNLLPL